MFEPNFEMRLQKLYSIIADDNDIIQLAGSFDASAYVENHLSLKFLNSSPEQMQNNSGIGEGLQPSKSSSNLTKFEDISPQN